MDRTDPPKVGILGGTFDPVHNGHLMIAREARGAAGLGCVLFVPAGTPPHKPARGIASPERRLAMVRLAIEGEAGFEASDLEVRSGGVGYTVDTLHRFRTQLPGARLHFIMGGDSLLALDQWRSPGELLQLASVVAVYRPGCPFEALERKRGELIGRFGGEIVLAACDGLDVSSTGIRQRLAAGMPISGLVPPAVEAYIQRHGLYRAD